MGVENFDKTRGKFLVEIKHEIFRFNSLSSGLEILVANAKFSVALASSWSQFRTLYIYIYICMYKLQVTPLTVINKCVHCYI